MSGREWAAVYLKGVFMGAADTVPGVSGGTIALITGIYERLIDAITGLDPGVVTHLPRLHTSEGRSALWTTLCEMDVPFLVVLGLGIVTSVAALSSVMHVAVKQYPVPTYAFFFGLIAASAVVLYRHVAVDTPVRIGVAIVGLVVAFVLSGASEGAGTTDPSLTFVFLAGGVAITAMILPGISGAFILVLLGLYEFMSGVPGEFISALLAVAQGGRLDTLADPGAPLIVFMVGAVIGVLTIAHLVRWALDHYHEATLAFLVALMVGALRVPIAEIRMGVDSFTLPMVVLVVGTTLVGALLVLGLDYFTDDLDY